MKVGSAAGTGGTPVQTGGNDEIKLLEKQRDTLKEELQKAKESKMDEKLKQEKVKAIQEQISQVETEIQKRRVEKLSQKKNETEDSSGSKKDGNSTVTASNADGDTLELSSMLEAGAALSSAKGMSKVKRSMAQENQILSQEIAFDEKGGHIATTKRAKRDENEKRMDELSDKVGKAEKKATKKARETTSDDKKTDRTSDISRSETENTKNTEAGNESEAAKKTEAAKKIASNPRNKKEETSKSVDVQI